MRRLLGAEPFLQRHLVVGELQGPVPLCIGVIQHHLYGANGRERGGNLHAFDLVFCRYPLGGVLNGSIKRLRYPIGTLTSWRVSQWFNRSRRQRSFSRETPAFLTDLFGEHLDLSWCFKYSGIDESCCLGVGKYHAARFLSKRNKKL